ncbi:MAG: glycoside hydrolase family 5 protein [Prevotella sp.]
MRFYLLLSLFATSALTIQAQITETATDAVKNMGLGWNLGNTFDANIGNGTDFEAAGYWGQQGVDSETCWGQNTTTPELITMMKNAGFGSIRIPVTWYNHMDKDGNVDKAWMARVHEVVDYVIDNGLYCILNVHHDTGASSSDFKHWIQASEDNYTQNRARFEKLWQQIAEEFKNYGKELVFEGYNEMLDPLSSWCFASFAASGQYDAAVATSAYNAINSYAQSFVNTVRATGGNNESRNLIVNTYAAANGFGGWNAHLLDPLTKLNMPDDNTAGHIIFEVHAYPEIVTNGNPISTTLMKKNVDNMITILKDNLVSKGGPVIIGEWGTSNVDKSGATDYDLYREELFQFVDYFVQQTKAASIGTFYWMGLTDGFYRSVPAFSQADLAERMAKAYHGSNFEGQYPGLSASEEVVVFEGSKKIGWGNPVTISASLFENFDENSTLTISFTQDADTEDDIQFFYGDWSDKLNFIYEGKSYFADFQPSQFLGSNAGSSHVIPFSFSSETCANFKKVGMLMQGNEITIKKVVLSSSTSGIEQLVVSDDDDAIYNTLGVRVKELKSGNIYIKNGKKIIAQ